MALADGDVIRFDYVLWVDGKVVETSMENVATEKGIHRDGRRYKPLTAILGAKQILPALESHIRSHGKTGAAVHVELSAADAYGAREASKIKDVPMVQFRNQKVKPEVGMTLTYEGSRGTITRVAGGRVRVDLNHELAGKALAYDYTLREVLHEDKPKIEAVVEGLLGTDAKVELTKDAVLVEVPDAAKFDQNWMMAKFRLISELRAAAGKERAVKLVETYPAMPDKEETPGHEGHGH
jgi:peptidylprolyl isomerase